MPSGAALGGTTHTPEIERNTRFCVHAKCVEAVRSHGLELHKASEHVHASRVAVCQCDTQLGGQVANAPIIIEDKNLATIPCGDGIQAWLTRQSATDANYHTLLPTGGGGTADKHYWARLRKKDNV